MLAAPVTLDGLLPKALSPTHYLKKLGVMPSKSKGSPAADAEAAAILDQQMAANRTLLLTGAAMGVVMLLLIKPRDRA